MATDAGPKVSRTRDEHPAEAAFDRGLAFRLGRLHRVLREDWEQHIADLAVTPAQASMLRAIGENPGIGLRQLARRMATDPMNAKRLADHLEHAGLAFSAGDPAHAQRRNLAPTAEGKAVARELTRRATAWNRRLTRRAGGAELHELSRLLGRLEQLFAVEDEVGAPLPVRARGKEHRHADPY
jgi:DNA-binding MarR family transcriptional regulator